MTGRRGGHFLENGGYVGLPTVAFRPFGELIVFARDVQKIVPQQRAPHSLGCVSNEPCALPALVGGQLRLANIIGHDLATAVSADWLPRKIAGSGPGIQRHLAFMLPR